MAKETKTSAEATDELDVPAGYTKVEFLINPTPLFRLSYNEDEVGIVRDDLVPALKKAKAIRVLS